MTAAISDTRPTREVTGAGRCRRDRSSTSSTRRAASSARIAACSRCRSSPGSSPVSSALISRPAAKTVERVGLPVAAVQREHQVAAELLVERVLLDQRLQPRHQLAVPAERQQRPRPHGHRGQPLRLERDDLRSGQRQVAEVLPGLTAPERERLVDQRDRGSGIRLRCGLAHEPAEPLRVDLDVVGEQAVGPALGDQPVAVLPERGAQRGHVDLEAAQRVGRAGLAPDLVDQPFDGYGGRRERRQHAEDRPLLARAQVDDSTVDRGLERPEYRDPEAVHPRSLHQ